MALKLINETTLTNIANAIRSKKGTMGSIQVSNFASEIESIYSGGGNDTSLLMIFDYVDAIENGADIDLEQYNETYMDNIYDLCDLITGGTIQ